ncbi:MAG: polyphenol oxidase family protein [Candidatus Rokubacteria bacterium]|nr:polyphenol oxidase family protein [Candidatus Rokubacteria bacterium]
MADGAPRLHGSPPHHLTSALLESAGLPHLFTTRHFPGVTPSSRPVSPFGPEAERLLAGRGLAREPAAYARQVHGADVAVAERSGLAGVADVLLTERPGLPVAIITADCLPIIVYDPQGGRLAGVHAGWRGTVQSAARAAAEALARAGGDPAGFVAAIGPSIGPCCYEVDGPVIERLEAAFPGAWKGWVSPIRPGKWMLDLWQANLDQLTSAGLARDRVDNPRLCTACHLDLFYSYRKLGRMPGRLVTVAALPVDGRR